jgi:hypothetical protein
MSKTGIPKIARACNSNSSIINSSNRGNMYLMNMQ